MLNDWGRIEKVNIMGEHEDCPCMALVIKDEDRIRKQKTVKPEDLEKLTFFCYNVADCESCPFASEAETEGLEACPIGVLSDLVHAIDKKSLENFCKKINDTSNNMVTDGG